MYKRVLYSEANYAALVRDEGYFAEFRFCFPHLHKFRGPATLPMIPDMPITQQSLPWQRRKGALWPRQFHSKFISPASMV